MDLMYQYVDIYLGLGFGAKPGIAELKELISQFTRYTDEYLLTKGFVADGLRQNFGNLEIFLGGDIFVLWIIIAESAILQRMYFHPRLCCALVRRRRSVLKRGEIKRKSFMAVENL